MELQLLLVELVRKFQFEVPENVKIHAELALVTLPFVDGDKTQRLPLKLSLVHA